MRRHILGMLALLLLGLGLGQLTTSNTMSSAAFLGNSGIRIGLVLAALWLAFPEVSRLRRFLENLPTWFFYTCLGSLFVAGLIRHPAALLLIVPLLFILWLLKPPKGKQRTQGQM